MNTNIHLGSSLGTAVLGAVLILGSFSGLSLIFNNQTHVSGPEKITGVHQLFEKLEIENPEDIDEKQEMLTIQKVNTMKFVVNIISLVFIHWYDNITFYSTTKKETKTFHRCLWFSYIEYVLK